MVPCELVSCQQLEGMGSNPKLVIVSYFFFCRVIKQVERKVSCVHLSCGCLFLKPLLQSRVGSADQRGIPGYCLSEKADSLASASQLQGSQINSVAARGKYRHCYLWQKSGRKKGVSVILAQQQYSTHSQALETLLSALLPSWVSQGREVPVRMW